MEGRTNGDTVRQVFLMKIIGSVLLKSSLFLAIHTHFLRIYLSYYFSAL